MEVVMYINKGHKIREDFYPHVSGFFLTVIKDVSSPLECHLILLWISSWRMVELLPPEI